VALEVGNALVLLDAVAFDDGASGVGLFRKCDRETVVFWETLGTEPQCKSKTLHCFQIRRSFQSKIAAGVAAIAMVVEIARVKAVRMGDAASENENDGNNSGDGDDSGDGSEDDDQYPNTKRRTLGLYWRGVLSMSETR
jgi:hypothetical protein